MTLSYSCSSFKLKTLLLAAVLVGLLLPLSAQASAVFVPVSRSKLVEFRYDMAEVIVADPNVADVHNHGTRKLSIIGKKKGQTTIRVFDKDSKLINTYNVTVGYDLPAVRKALRDFLPGEMIGVEMVNQNIALTGQVSSAAVADKAIRIAREFFDAKTKEATKVSGVEEGGDTDEGILNLMEVTSGQQVMLRVRVGEINRSAIKQLGIEWSNFGSPGNTFYQIAKDSGIERFVTGSTGAFTVDSTDTLSYLTAGWSNGGTTIAAMIKALERDNLFKLLAEPNLVAVSGEEAEFLAGGEIPIPVPQTGSGTNSITIEYKPFGVAVKFKPFVISENRLRIEVQPEVSELDPSIAITVNGFQVPGLTTRRAKTTVEMAPGESFMIAGLIKDQSEATVESVPGIKELPILGGLFRSTNFQRNETELVIAVTPYLVDPMRNNDIKLPTDNFEYASDMEMYFYGALGSLVGENLTQSQTPSLEGPIGYMVD